MHATFSLLCTADSNDMIESRTDVRVYKIIMSVLLLTGLGSATHYISLQPPHTHTHTHTHTHMQPLYPRGARLPAAG